MLGCLRALDAELRERGSGLVVREGVARQGAGRARGGVRRRRRAVGQRRRALRAGTRRGGHRGAARRRRRARPSARQLRGRRRADPHGHRRPVHRLLAVPPGVGARRAARRAPRARGRCRRCPPACARAALPSLDDLGLDDDVPEPVCPPGEAAARAEAEALARRRPGSLRRAPRHARGRDVHAVARGPLGPAVGARARGRARRHGGAGPRAFVAQLCWRDFYAHVLLHHPEDVRSEHQERYRGMRWGGRGRRCSRRGRRGARATPPWTRGCGSSAAPGGCTTARG